MCSRSLTATDGYGMYVNLIFEETRKLEKKKKQKN